MNKKADSKVWYLILGLMIVGVLGVVFFGVIGDIGTSSKKLSLSASCGTKDYDGDGFENSLEALNAKLEGKKQEYSCPCDSPRDSKNIVLNPDIWKSKDDTGPYVIFDYSKREKLAKIESLNYDDVDFLMWFIENIDKLPTEYRTDYFKGEISSYLKPNLGDLADELKAHPAFFCPSETSFDKCGELSFMSAWFEAGEGSTPTKVALTYACSTDVDECTALMNSKCALDKDAEDEGKVTV